MDWSPFSPALSATQTACIKHDRASLVLPEPEEDGQMEREGERERERGQHVPVYTSDDRIHKWERALSDHFTPKWHKCISCAVSGTRCHEFEVKTSGRGYRILPFDYLPDEDVLSPLSSLQYPDADVSGGTKTPGEAGGASSRGCTCPLRLKSVLDGHHLTHTHTHTHTHGNTR